MNYEIYCDESCWEALYDKDSHLYAAIGGVWIPAEKRQEVKTYINNLKKKYGYDEDEIKTMASSFNFIFCTQDNFKSVVESL